MSNLAAKLKEQRSTAVNESVRNRMRTSTTRQESTSAAPTNNAVYKIMFEGNASPTERKETLAKFMAATMDRETDKARIAAYEEFREFLANQNTELAKKIIELTNTKTFASLQKIIEDMNSGLIEFEDDLKPLMEIVDSIYQLRTSGFIDTAFREIEEDRKRDENRRSTLDNLESDIEKGKRQISDLQIQNAELSQKRGFFGMGGPTEEARKAIASNEARISQIREEEARKQAELMAVRDEVVNRDSKLGEMAIHKERLRELLDLSSEENTERVARLRDSALNFVNHAKDSTDTIRGEFGTLSEQLDNTEQNNRRMLGVYAILSDGMREAARSNISNRENLNTTLADSGDDLIAKLDTEDKIRNLDSHSKMLQSAQGETINTYAELHQQSIRVNAMMESTRQQVDVARKLNTQGVSATADRLASTMTAISGAAIGESAGVVELTLDRMREKTNEITQQEVIRNAMYVDKVNMGMESVFAELETFRDTQRVSSDIIREGLITMNENMAALHQQTQELKVEMQESLALNTQLVHTGEEATKVETSASVAKDNPFL